MSANVPLAIRIAAIFDNKGLKQADKATGALEKGVKKLAGTLAAAFSVQKIAQFGKAAAKAFIEDEKAATRLAQSVKNLGLAFETPRIEEFISQMANASGVTDDQLRPAMQRLLQTTGSVTKSTALLTQALDISRGSGVDYETVVNDLTMAYVGQTRGLRKYNLGLTQAELKAASFADIQNKLTNQFTGANAAYLETYAGKMGILSNAAGEATETIGKGLVESLSLLAGEGNSIQPLADSMQEFATYISDAILGLAKLIDKMKSIPGADFVMRNRSTLTKFSGSPGLVLSALEELTKFGAAQRTTPGMGGYPSSALGPGYVDPNDAARKKAEAEAAKRAKALADMQKKTLDTQKKSNALTKAAKTLDLDRIGITAALRNQVSETDRLSLNLQLALLDKNDAAALKLSAELDSAVRRQNALNAALAATPEAPNPYRNWKAPDMTPIATAVAPTATTPGTPSNPLGIPYGEPVPGFTPHPFSVPATGGIGGALGLEDLRGKSGAITVVVNLDGQEVGNVVRDVSINESLSGSFNTVNRVDRFRTLAI